MTTRYGYRASNAQGVLQEGEIEAPSEQGAVDALRRKSLWATDVWPRDTAAKSVGNPAAKSVGAGLSERWYSPARSARGVPAGALATVTRALSTLLASGVPLDEGLHYASTQSPAGVLREAFAAVRTAVRNGRSLSDAFRAQPVFPPLYAALAATGEATGALDTALARLAEHTERSDELRARMQAALLYPTLLGGAAIVGVTVIMLVVVPRFAVLLQQAGSTLPVSTRMLMAFSMVFTRGWPILLLVAVALPIGWRQWIANAANRHRWHKSRLSWPIIGALEQNILGARYARTLALAIPSGVDLLTAMQLARGTVGNAALGTQLQSAEARVRDGISLSTAVAGILPPLAVQLLHAGEASGALAPLAARAADALDLEVQRGLARAVTFVEPLLILGFGALIGFVALGLLQAIYGINASTL